MLIQSRIQHRNEVSFLHLTLNRANALNALNTRMIEQLHSELKKTQDRSEVEFVFLDSIIDKAFCAGGDVKNIVLDLRQGNVESGYEFFTKEYALNEYMYEYPKPIITWGQGIIMGGGVGIHIPAKYSVVSDKTLWAMPEVAIGFFPDVGASWFLSQIEEWKALFIATTGVRLSANSLIQNGLAQFYISQQNKDKVIDEICSGIPIVQVFNSIQKTDFDNCPLIQRKENLFEVFHLNQEFDDYFGGLLKLSESEDKWIRNNVKRAVDGYKSSIKILFEMLKWSRGKSRSECFRNELGIAKKLCHSKDFIEGVSRLLIRN